MAGGGQAPGVHHNRQRGLSAAHTVDLCAGGGGIGGTYAHRDCGDVVDDHRHDRVVYEMCTGGRRGEGMAGQGRGRAGGEGKLQFCPAAKTRT